MIYQITAANLGELLTWAFVVVLAAVIVGVFFVDIIYAVFSRVFSSSIFSFEPTSEQVHRHILDGAARLRAIRDAHSTWSAAEREKQEQSK